MTVIAIIACVGCSSTTLDRTPSSESSETLKLIEKKNLPSLVLDRKFLNSQNVQDVNVCGELFRVEEYFYIRSQCHIDKKSNKYFGLSRVAASLLLQTTELPVWNAWTRAAEEKTKTTGQHVVPFICIRSRGFGDPCDRENGSLIQRVSSYTSSEEEFQSW